MPDFWADSVYDIDYEALRRKGLRFLFFDIDNTMALYSEQEPSERLLALLRRLSEMGFRSAILSNGRSGRVARFAKIMGMEFEGGALKPAQGGFRRLAQKLRAEKSSEIAMIGDQIYTDIKGGKRFGCCTVLVTPIDLADDPFFVRFKRIFEKNVVSMIRRNENGCKTKEE